MFSDETTFELYRRRPRVWRRKGEPVVYGTVKHPVKVQAWGCFHSKGFGHISTFGGNLNATKLCKIYNKTLVPSAIEAFGRKGKWTLQEASAGQKYRTHPNFYHAFLGDLWCGQLLSTYNMLIPNTPVILAYCAFLCSFDEFHF